MSGLYRYNIAKSYMIVQVQYFPTTIQSNEKMATQALTYPN